MLSNISVSKYTAKGHEIISKHVGSNGTNTNLYNKMTGLQVADR